MNFYYYISIGVIYPHIQSILVQEINEASYYSIGLDETPHSSKNIFALTIRYFYLYFYTQLNTYLLRYLSKDGIKNRVLQFVDMTSKKAVDQVDLIKKGLESFGLNKMRMIAFTADNTNTNFGGVNRGGENNIFWYLKKGNLVIGNFIRVSLFRL